MTQAVRRTLLLVAVAILAAGGTALAQDSRGAIQGLVTDSQGATVPGAKVTVISKATNATTALTTNRSGQFSALYLTPGLYDITVEQTGFKTIRNESVQVRVGDRLTLDFRLDPRGVTEEIEVLVVRPLLDDSSATTGQVVDSAFIRELPLADGTPYSFIRQTPGVVFTGGYALQQPMANGNLAGIMAGGAGRNEFTIDGTSNIGQRAQIGISPPAETVEEFKVETTVYDAQHGHTGGGNVNLALKSGSNLLHGTGYFFGRPNSLGANDWASNKYERAKATRDYYRWGGQLSGPLIRNKTFFMASYEKFKDDQVEPSTRSVPTQAMRNGDFSELLASNIRIYDPATARPVSDGKGGTIIQRDYFKDNIIPANRISPIAANVMKYLPLPNQAGVNNNYFAQQPWIYHYNLQMLRLDHQLSSNHRLYLRGIHNWREEGRYDWAGIQNGFPITRGGNFRHNWNASLGYSGVLKPSLFLDVKFNFLRYAEVNDYVQSFDPISLGFAADTERLMRNADYFPRFQIADFSIPTYDSLGGGAPTNSPFYNISLAPTFTKTAGTHTIKFGYDLRILREMLVNPGNMAGSYTFNGDFTRPSSTSPSQLGQGLASFLLGQPTAGTFDTRPDYAAEIISHGFFVHDDWRVTSKLTLNIGVRYDIELGLTESQNRSVRAFDTTSQSPLAAQVQAAYAKAPITEVPASQLQVLGGYTFLSADNPRAWDAQLSNIQPRFGLSYRLGASTVLRGGVGLYVEPFQITGLNAAGGIMQPGYTRPTPMTITGDSGLTFVGTLQQPFPVGTQLLQPVGSTQGLGTNMGNNLGAINITPVDRVNPRFWRFSAGIQRKLPGDVVLELSYMGSRGRNLMNSTNINALPQKYVSTSATRDKANDDFLGAGVTNPFKGLMTDSPSLNGNTIARRQLLRPYPMWGDLNVQRYTGTNTYDAAIVRVEKRFSNGISLMANYTYSTSSERNAQLNPWEDLVEYTPWYDRPHRVAVATVIQFPFGKGRKWGSNWNPIVDGLFGGWQLSANYQFQSGNPLSWGNVYWNPACGNPKDLKMNWGHTPSGGRYGWDAPVFDTSCFYFHDAAVQTNGVDDPKKQAADTRIALGTNVRTFPVTAGRWMPHHWAEIGIGKTFTLRGRMKLQLRAEAINAFNYTIWRDNKLRQTPTSNDFGYLFDAGQTTVVIRPRDIQLGARLTF